MKYELHKDTMRNEDRRASFNQLTKSTFGFTFEDWYQSGYFEDFNQPYTLFDGDKAIANISANDMKVICEGQEYHYLQIGTVMTDKEYRNQGLSRMLMNEIIKDFEGRCEAMFLFANKTVLEFYPKFGFKKEEQYEYRLEMSNPTNTARKLDMQSEEDRALLLHKYQSSNPFSKLQVVDNASLLMFYCTGFMKNSIYYSEEQDAIVIASRGKEELECYDIFCEEGKDMEEILRSVATEATKQVVFLFTPMDGKDYMVTKADSADDTLFVRAKGENVFHGKQLMFPEISHT